ncbi:hypothetical protein LIER_03172 [Lithospermum erythrorhizon]|uniref:Protein kinase domain-containing protein n=1 Tax=Lithospermum erythrorhizon TaxID=34254 RepID=A0AAV3NS62_LITER
MNLLKFLIHLVTSVVLLILQNNEIMADDSSPIGFHDSERNALEDLKEQFNNSILHGNWTSLMCYMNDQPRWMGIQCLNGRVTGIVLENIGLKGTIKKDSLFNLTELSIISFKNNFLSGHVMEFSNNHKLKKVDLSGNIFDGEIPTSLLDLNTLESLQLQNNKLTGPVLAFNQPSLKQFNVSHNDLSGSIPNTTLQSFNYSSYIGNNKLCGAPSPKPCLRGTSDISSDSNDSSHSWVAILVVINVIAFLVLLFLAMFYHQRYKNLKKRGQMNNNLVHSDEEKQENMIQERVDGLEEGENKRRLTFFDENEASFEIDDMLKAAAEGLGKGSFGNSYKAKLGDSKIVVVKRLMDLKPLSRDEFVMKVMTIAELKHPNLLPLKAYYYSTEEKLFVQRFASNGNLFNRIHGGRGTRERIPFRWSSRLSVARAIARAIEYLHINTTSEISIPHGNLKSSNVLFGENDVVLVSDYGLTSIIAIPIATQRMVAFQSPEYKTRKKASRKSDVWSYGCLILELLTGKVSVYSSTQGGLDGFDLCDWVHRAVREEWTAEIFDVEILSQRSANTGMLTLMQIAMRCCDKATEKRPEMSEVVREVESIKLTIESQEDGSMEQSFTDDSAISATP